MARAAETRAAICDAVDRIITARAHGCDAINGINQEGGTFPRAPHAARRTRTATVTSARDEGHPGPVAIALSADMVQALVDHARAEYPNEMCGVIVGDRPAATGGRPLRWEPTRNKAASPLRYEIHPDDLLRLSIETDDADETFWAIVHSHTHSPARPSPTDTGLAFYPDAIYLLVSLADPQPALAAWRILDGEMFPVELKVDTAT